MISKSMLRNESGYTLAMVAVFITILLVGLSEAVINWQKAMQREREEELIFRGKQYVRAIELWQRKFPGTYPTSLDALLNTNNMRFLRKKWKDPITGSEEWRLIKLNPDGSISGLTVIPSGMTGQRDATIPGIKTQNLGSMPGTSGPGTGAGTNVGQQSARDSGRTFQMGTVQATDQRRSTLQSSASPVLGGIVGVASKSDKESLKTYNGRSKYSEWEFYYVPRPQSQAAPQKGPGTPLPGVTPSRGSSGASPPGSSSSSVDR